MKKLIVLIGVLFSLLLVDCSCGEDDGIIILPPIDPPILCETNEDCLKNIEGCFTGLCLAGECHYGYFADGVPCDDKNPCTAHGECLKGNCIRGEFIKCASPDQCQEEGKCNTLTGECLYLNKLDRSPCDDENSCTIMDQCKNGECISLQEKECPLINPCLLNGLCNKTTGACEYSCKLDGTPCDNGVWCDGLESCQDGICVDGSPPCIGACDERHKHCPAECALDSDCDNGINCDGKEWCCTWKNSDRSCEKYYCYEGINQCGDPFWAPFAICDMDLDICRGCYYNEECNDNLYCTGEERCTITYPWHGTCYHINIPCMDPNLICNEEWQKCIPRPSCLYDYECDLEQFCDENGKCSDY